MSKGLTDLKNRPSRAYFVTFSGQIQQNKMINTQNYISKAMKSEDAVGCSVKRQLSRYWRATI
jgi:hypothetical protein